MSVFSPNTRKHRPEKKIRIRTFFYVARRRPSKSVHVKKRKNLVNSNFNCSPMIWKHLKIRVIFDENIKTLR